MARRGQKKHLKRLPAPKHWPIKRKHGKFTTKPLPGPHAKEECLTLTILLREMMGRAENMREVKAILSSGVVLVDGRPRKNPRFPVGLMDVIEITSSNDRYRLLPKTRGGFRLVSIDEDESKFKLARIQRKMMAPGGKCQLTLHDGRNILLPENMNPSDFRTLDTLVISIPEQDLLENIKMEPGAQAIVTKGRNVGMEGTIVEIEKRIGTHASTVTVQDPEGNRFQTALEYVFVLGKDQPKINLGMSGGSVE